MKLSFTAGKVEKMAIIDILTDPAGIRKIERCHIEDNSNILDFFIEKYGAAGFGVPFKLYLSTISDESEVVLDDNGKVVKNGDYYILILRPQGIETLVTSFVVSLLVGVAAGYVAAQLLPKPSVPNSEQTSANESPNNSLTAQTNVARPLERIPDIYGKNRVFPDMITSPHIEYVNNLKIITQWFGIGRGEYLIEEVKNEDTLAGDIRGQSYDIIEPNEIVPLQLIPRIYEQVDGLDLINAQQVWSYSSVAVNFFFAYGSWAIDRTSPFNQLGLGSIVSIVGSLSNDGIWYTAGTSDRSYFQGTMSPELGLNTRIVNFYNRCILKNTSVTLIDEFTLKWEKATRPNILDFSIGDQITITNCSAFVDPVTFTISDIDDLTLDVTVEESIAATFGTYAADIEQTKTNEWFGNVFVEKDYCEELFFNFVAQLGTTSTASILIELISENTSGTYGYDITVGSSTTDAIYQTLNAKLKDDLAAGYDSFVLDGIIVRMRKLNVSDVKIKWESLTGCKRLINHNYGNVTLIKNVKKATLNPLKGQSSKLNCVATRKLWTYDLDTQEVIKTNSTTVKFADAIMNVLIDSKCKDRTDLSALNSVISSIDLYTLYGIQKSLDDEIAWGGRLGEFCYSFSNKNTPVIEELQTILNACRCYMWREGNKFKFGRDEAKLYPRMLFNARNKKPDGEIKSVALFKPNDYDGIEFQWINNDTNEPEIILYPPTATNYKRIDSAGIKNYNQAYNRCLLEYNKLMYRRRTVKTSVTKDGLLLSLGDRIINCDGTTARAIQGEVVGLSGLEVTVDTVINWGIETTGTAYIRGEIGEIESVGVTKINENSFTLDNALTCDIIVAGSGVQIGSLFTLTLSQAKNDYTVEKMSVGDDGYINLELTEYNGVLYSMDEEMPN